MRASVDAGGRSLSQYSQFGRSSRAIAASSSPAGRHVLVDVEDVVGVVGVLQRDEPLVGRRGVGGLHALGALAPEVVDVDAVGVGRHGREELTRPRDVLGVFVRVLPDGQDRELEGGFAVAEGGGVGPGAPYGATEVLEV